MTDGMSLAESLDWLRLQSDFERRTSLCKRRSCCHPGRQFGGPEACRNPYCACHGEVS